MKKEKLYELYKNIEYILENLNNPSKAYIEEELVRIQNFGIVQLRKQKERQKCKK